jgi:hypothetical protein
MTSAEVATGTAVKTMMQVVAAANHRVLLNEISVSFDGVNNAHAPVLVQVLRQDDSGTGTAVGDELQKLNDSDDETLEVTGVDTFTGEPTGTTEILMTEFVHPQTGFCWQAPFGKEIPIKGGNRMGIRVTAANDVGCIVRVAGEE